MMLPLYILVARSESLSPRRMSIVSVYKFITYKFITFQGCVLQTVDFMQAWMDLLRTVKFS